MTFIPTRDFLLEVSKRNIEGHTSIHKFGANNDVDIASTETVWPLGIAYTFSAIAATYNVSSTNAGDTQTITALLLDDNWDLQEVSVVLTGQTQAAFTGTYIRFIRAWNSSATATAGDIYIAETGATTAGVPNDTTLIKGFIPLADQQSLQAVMSTPANKTSFLLDFSLGVVSLKTANFKLRMREFGGVFRTRDDVRGVADHVPIFIPVPPQIPEKSDIIFEVDAAANNTEVHAIFNMLIVDTTLVNLT
jgi:hypothetical protein